MIGLFFLSGKHYDLVYSSEEESKDLLVDLVSKIRKKKGKSRKEEYSESDSDSDRSGRRKKKMRKTQKHKQTVLSQVDSILAPQKPKKFGAKTLSKIDDILFSDITNSDHANKKCFLSEVDKILDLGNRSKSEDSDTSKSGSDSDSDIEETDETDKEDIEDLTESEMRLLNLININKIDMKLNFPSSYPDTSCHFCR